MSTLAPTICAACAELLISPAIIEPHDLMARQGGPTELLGSNHTEEYRCFECESAWRLYYEQGSLAQAKLCSNLIDDRVTSTSVVIAARSQHFHNNSITASCRALHSP